MAWREGEAVGPYSIVRQLGQGGMATVYLGLHAQLDRQVAIKVMHETFLDDETFVLRFRREAQIVASLEHSHIVPVYDFNEHDGRPYLVMKYVEGETLKDRLRRGTLPVDEILHIMEAVSSALTYAHSKGVLHRDIKPSNIVIDTDNVPYLADFGLARIAAAGESTMSADMLLGTPHYISPEQARGVRDLDGRTDIYSLGVVLYELLVGHVPFSAETPFAIIHDHIYTQLPSPSKINPEIPLSVEEVLITALSKSPTERFDTADEMMQALRDAVEEAGLSNLNEDRAAQAAVSLARAREALEADYQNAATPVMPGIPAADGPTMMGTGSYRTATVYAQQDSSRFWKIGGCGAFLLIAFLSLAVVLNASAGMVELIEMAANNAETISVRGFRQVRLLSDTLSEAGLELDESAGYPRYIIPPMPLASAEAIQDAEPRDFISYLILAQAYWRNDRPDEAYDAIQQGYLYTDEEPVYLANAATIAHRADDSAAAIGYYVLALHMTGGNQNDETTQALRADAGQYIYENAGNLRGVDTAQLLNSLIPISVVSQDELTGIATSPALWYAIARNRFLEGNPQTALLALNRIDEDNRDEPEIRLVRGESLAAQGRDIRANNEWDAILEADNIPEWIVQRTNTLLEETENN